MDFALTKVRLARLSSWLNNNAAIPSQTKRDDDIELITHSDALSSKHGIVSLRSTPSSTISTFSISRLTQPCIFSRLKCDRSMCCTGGNSGPLECDLLDRKDAINYEIAGRHPDIDYKDLRSASRARKRDRQDREKYWSYRHMKRGQRGAPYYADHDPGANRRGVHNRPLLTFAEHLNTALVVEMTPRMFWEKAQGGPRPSTFHHRPRWVANEGRTPVLRSRRVAKKHANQRDVEDYDDALRAEERYLVLGLGDEISYSARDYRQSPLESYTGTLTYSGLAVKDEMSDWAQFERLREELGGCANLIRVTWCELCARPYTCGLCRRVHGRIDEDIESPAEDDGEGRAVGMRSGLDSNEDGVEMKEQTLNDSPGNGGLTAGFDSEWEVL